MFSSNHRQHLLVAFRHLDAVLAEVSALLAPVPRGALIAQCIDDVDADTRRRAEIGIAAVRGELCAFMTRHALRLEPPDLSARHAANAQLALTMVEATELGPRHLRGYGALTENEAEELAGLSERLRARLVDVIRALPESPR
ncbi:MAG: hypothetical protein ACREPK_11920 [Rhodanobacteraceae bacterium]